MITIHCSNPICGKSFFFDETKFPDAKKVQCPHCKTIQDLKPGGGKEQEEAFFEEPAKPAPAPVAPGPAESFSAPESGKEDFFSESTPEPRQPTAPVAEEPTGPSRLLLFVLLPALVIVAGVLAYIFWPPLKPEPLPQLPAFEAGISAGTMLVTAGDSVSVSITTTPFPDTGLLVRLFAGGRLLSENTDGSFSVDTLLQTPGQAELSFWIEVFRAADNATVRDTASLTIEVKEKEEKKEDEPAVPSNKEITRFDLRRKASRAKWFAEYRNKDAVAMTFGTPLKKSGDFYGEVKLATNVAMEDGQARNGIEIIPGDKEGSKVIGEYRITELPNNPVFKAYLGFTNDSGSNGEVVLEIRGQLQDDSYKILGVRSKKKSGSLVLLEYPIAPYDIKKIRIDVISKKRGQNKVVLVNPMIDGR